MNLYIRDRTRFITFLGKDNFDNFLNNYREMRSSQKVLIGDYFYFTSHMRQMLLKFVEEFPNVDIYSSFDISDPILLSRCVRVIKAPHEEKRFFDISAFKESNITYLSIYRNLDPLQNKDKLVIPYLDKYFLDLHLAYELNGENI